MNKLFKVIWSKSKQCYIVVSEVAKNTTGKKKIAVASVLAALAVSAQVATVQAAIPEGTLTDGAIVAIGGNVKANGDSSVVIGKNNEVKTRFSVGIGNNILTESDNAVAIGSGSNNGQVKATGADSIAIGTRAEATMQSSIAIGRLSKSITGERGVAIGNEAVTTGYAAIAIGEKVKANSKNSISMGNGASAKAEGAIVMGANASAEVKNSVALGEGSTTVSADAAETTGYLTNDTVNNSEHGVLSIGNGSTITRRILSVASGTNDTDAVNVKQLKALRNATVSTLSVVDGSTTTDVVPTTSVPASVTDVNERAKLEKELHKVKLVAGKNITLTADGNAVTIASKSEVNSITSTNADAISITTGTDGTVSVTPNLASDVNADADANKLVTAGKVKAALDQKANASDVNDLKAKLGNTAADGRDGKAAGTAGTTAAEKGLTGQDGLNGKSLTDKVNALRNGEAGSVVYTDDQGNRLVKANDGKYYKATQVGTDGNKIGDATPIGEDKLQASVMNPDGTKNPTKLSNLKDGKIAENSKDAVTGNQLHKVGKGLADALGGGAAVAEDGTITAPTYTVTTADGTGTETASNVGVAISKLDTRITTANGALVTKGLDFTGNDTTAKVHRDLGTTLTIKGAENFTRADAETNNIKVVNKNNDLDVKLAENLGNIKSISNATGAGKPGSTITLDADGVSIANTAAGAAGAAGDTKTVTIGKDGINAGKMRITNVATAEADGDVTNKQYVDGAVKALKDKVAKLGDTTADGRDGKAATGKAADDPDATAADKGLTGQDGLNGKSLTDKVNALRNGEAGSVVYTDDEGNRLVKANDGKYYKATQVGTDGNKIGDATPIGEDKLQASVMNPDGTKNPTKLSNLKDGKIAENSKDAVTGNQLYAAKAEVAKYLGGNAAVAEDGTITEPTYTIKDKDGKDVQKHNVGDALSTMNDRLNAANSAVTADITNLKNMEGLTAAGINKIKELAGQGVNVTGDKNITVEPTVEKGVKTFHATLSDDLKLGGPDKEHPNVRVNGTDSTVTAGTGDKEVKMNGADGTITAGDGANGKQVKLDGKDGSVQANKVTAGKDDKAVSLDGDTGTITAGTGENAVAINGTNATIKAGTGENQVGINGRDGSVTAKTVKAKGGNFGAPVDAKGIPTEVGTATSMDKDGFSVATKDEKGNVSKVDIKNGGITAGAPVDAKGIPTEVGTTTSMDKDNGFSVTTKDKDGNVSKVTIKDGKISGLNGSEYDNYKKDDKGNIVKDKDGNPVVDSKVSVNGSGMTITPTEKDKQPVSLTKDGLNNGGNKITNVKDGVIAQGSNDVVNGNQIFNANTSIAAAIGGDAKVQKDGTISAPKFEITVDGTNPASKTPVTSVGAAIEALDARINNARNLGDLTPAGKKVITDLINVKGEGNIEVPEATTDDKGVKTFTVKLKDTVTLGKGANQVQMDGTQGVVSAGEGKNKVEMNGAKGTITLGEKDGDTNVKLNASKGSVTANIGTFGAPVDGNGIPTAAGSATSMDKDGFSVTSKDENGNVSKVTIKDGRVSAGNPVDAKGIPTEAGSATSMDKDGFSVATKDEKGNVSKVDIKNGGITAGAPVDEKGVPTKEGVNTTTITDKGLSVVSKNADGTVSKVEIKDGKITGLNGSEYNNYKKDEKGNVVKDKDGKPVVDSSVKMDGAGLSIAPSTGDPKKSVSLTKDGLNNGGNRITNVADGIEDSDAVTVGQVKEVTSKLGAALEKTSQRVSEVGAHSAALAAMNPLSYDPLRKSQIMAGIGSYDGNQALALGIAHYANENFMFNAGITMGSGKSMANIGATYRFGTGDDDNIPERYKGGPISSVYVMQDEISALKAENARKDAENAEMKAQIKMLMERMGMA